MMRNVLYVLLISLFLTALCSGASQGAKEDLEEATTFIFGYVVDADTGEPVEDADVWITNRTYSRLFYAETDELGYYEIQVGGPGNYLVEAYSPIHEWTITEVEIDYFEWKEINLSLNRYDHDVYFYLQTSNMEGTFEGARIRIFDLNGVFDPNGDISSFELFTDEEGKAAVDLDPGNYSYSVET
ncbi:MAG: carboxypeptidase regulatory-like domain-containing protein, partial [Candidatus Thermoplasmatota archaeon]|nr:carboxypeptidase regulatory-like domain-containing protein [Candidatus Thermoplasmatota archaeon]